MVFRPRTLIPRLIIKYIPLQQGLRPFTILNELPADSKIIKYIPLQQGLRRKDAAAKVLSEIIKYIPLQQGLRLN